MPHLSKKPPISVRNSCVNGQACSLYGLFSQRSAFWGYVGGLGTTIAVMNVFQAAQPALLYIVPAVLAAVGLHAHLRGEFQTVRHAHGVESCFGFLRCLSRSKVTSPCRYGTTLRMSTMPKIKALRQHEKSLQLHQQH